MKEKIGRSIPAPVCSDWTGKPAVSSPGFVDLYPHLTEFLAKSRGSVQTATTGTLTLFLEAGIFKLCLNDRPLARSTFVSGSTLHLALFNAEGVLASGRAKWRTRGYLKAPDRQKTLNQC
jgi:hypothetical protein